MIPGAPRAPGRRSARLCGRPRVGSPTCSCSWPCSSRSAPGSARSPPAPPVAAGSRSATASPAWWSCSSRGRRGWSGPASRPSVPSGPRSRWPRSDRALFFGLTYATGLVRSVAGVAGMWLHVAFALALVPPGVAPGRPLGPSTKDRPVAPGAAAGRPARPRRRRAVRRPTTVVDRLRLPGRPRRFTGSYRPRPSIPTRCRTRSGSTTPRRRSGPWRLTVRDAAGEYDLGLSERAGPATGMRATLDCTSGWYAEQDWTGVPVSPLIRGSAGPGACWSTRPRVLIRFPVRDLDRLLLATGVGGSLVGRARVPAAPGRARPAGVLVGEMGGPDPAGEHAVVVAAAVPGHLGPGPVRARRRRPRPGGP